MIRDKILLTGAKGQLGHTFSVLFEHSELSKRYKLQTIDVEEVDFTDSNSIHSALSGYAASIIVNCGAYTAVDQAERHGDLAEKINCEAVAIMTEWAQKERAKLIQISTDFVFDGNKRTPYRPDDLTNPLGVYGRTKLAGEEHVLNNPGRSGLVIRTSWLYSEFCSNFVKTMIRLMKSEEEIKVVNDQVGSPTSTRSLVTLIFRMIGNKTTSGIFHWSDGAEITWYDFAIEIQKQAFDEGILKSKIPIRPTETSAYPTLAKRPPYSVLDRRKTVEEFGLSGMSWKEELNRVIGEIAKAG